MTNPVARLYAVTLSVLGLFLAWAGIAAHPWRPAPPDPTTELVARYESRLRQDATLVAAIVARRREQVTTPLVRVVTLPPLTTTRTS